MSAVRRYAEGTTVSVDSSRGEITGLLAKHGVVRMGWMASETGDELMFELKGGSYRLDIRRPALVEIRRDFPNTRDEQSKMDAEWRRRWRANVLLLKAKLEFADGETTTLDRELLAYRVLKDGRTIEQALTDGNFPLLLAAGK